MWAQAAAYVNAHHEEMEPPLAQFMSMPLDVLHKMTRGVYATAMTADIQPVVDVAAKHQMIDKPFPAGELSHPAVR